MKRVLVLGRDPEPLLSVARQRGLRIVREDPEVVITYGGDGLLLRAEHAWPGIPKLPLRNSRHGIKCQPHEIPEALDRLIADEFVATAYHKVEATVGSERKIGLNEVLIHNAAPTSAIRYRVLVDGRDLGHEHVGDGVVVATRFGSTAYYRAITRGSFREGLGIAFNNSTEHVDHLVVLESAVITVRIVRGPATLFADNQPDGIDLDEGDTITIRQSPEQAVILGTP